MIDPMGEWRVKYDGTCARCNTPLLKGTSALWDRVSRTMRCIECPRTTVDPVDLGVAGRSARDRHEALEARRQAAITERWGTGLASKVVRALSVEPQSTRAWAIGAAGEEQLASELAQVPDLWILNDRRVPRTRGNIDHILVSSAGVFVVDAKNNKGQIGIRDRGGFFRSDQRLTIGGRDCSSMADKMEWQVEAVRSAMIFRRIERLPSIVPVLCFLSVEWPVFRPPESFRGVRLESHRSLKRLVANGNALGADEAAAVAAALSIELPPK